MAVLHNVVDFAIQNPIISTFAVTGGMVATVAVPKQPITQTFVENLIGGFFIAFIIYFWFLDDLNSGIISKNRLRVFVGIGSLIALPCIRLVFFLLSNPSEAIKLWQQWRNK